MKRFCSRCLFYDGMQLWLHPHSLPAGVQPITVNPDGLCSVCTAYAKTYSRDVMEMSLGQLQRLGTTPVIACYSGGKDSTAMLAYVRGELGLNVKAVMFDNGLIPSEVIDRGSEVCERLGVDLHVVTRDHLAGMSAIPTVADELAAVSRDRLTPCVACAAHISAAAVELARRNGTTWVLQGTNYFAQWTDAPTPIRMVTIDDYTTRFFNVPYALGWTQSDVQRRLADVQFRALELKGVSSNCVVPGIVQGRIARSIGHVPELEDLSLEIVVGHLTRESALQELSRKAPLFNDLIAEAV